MLSALLLLEGRARTELWRRIIEVIEDYAASVPKHRVAAELDPEKIRALLRPFDFTRPVAPLEAVNFVAAGLWHYQAHAPHPRYFGLFNPAPTTMGVAADTLVAAFNPQLANWSRSPFAIEIEQHLVRAFASRFGFDPSKADGTFASGGAEANHTALLAALTAGFRDFPRRGVRALAAQPVIYVSSEAHDSFLKAARLTGLGTDAVRKIPVDDQLQMDLEALVSRLHRDRQEGFAPAMVVATAGTTTAGVVDPIVGIADIAAREKIWFHVDAAWGGAVVLVPELRHLLEGIERADSITFDAHKWLSVPMGAGLFLTRHPDILARTFHVPADYMPRDALGLDVIDPYVHSIQWSRRFIGLKVFLSLAVAGWDGYAATIRQMVSLGNRLRAELKASGWEVVNKTALPLACFVERQHPQGRSAAYLEAVARKIVSSGEAWISATCLAGSTPALRACITNYRTQAEDVQALVDALNRARDQLQAVSA